MNFQVQGMTDKPCLMDQCSDVELHKAGEYFCSVAAHMCDVVAVMWDRGISTTGKCSAAVEVDSEVCLAWYPLPVPFTS